MQTGFYQLRSLPLARKRCINLYPQINEDSAFSKIALFGTPGIESFVTTGLPGVARGCIEADGVPYYVIGNKLVSFNRAGVLTIHSGNITGTNNVVMKFNTKTIAIVDPYGDSYFFTLSTQTLVQIVDATFLSYGQVRSVDYKDGYFVFSTDRFWFNSSHYDNNNGQVFDALDFGVKDIGPDLIVAPFTSNDLLYIIGQERTSIWDNIVTNAFPFAEIDGANLEIGCQARQSITKFDGDFVMIGGGKNEKPSVFRVRSQSHERISTDAIDYVIGLSTEDELARARIDTYAQDGHPFLVLKIGNYSFSYDQKASDEAGGPIWHERQSGITNGESFLPWRGQHICKAHNTIYVGDSQSSVIGKLQMDTYREFGERIERVVIGQPVNDKGSPVFQNEIEMFIEAGVGNADSTDPAWLFSYSDNGRNFGNAIPRAMGKQGEYDKRLVWRRQSRIPAKRIMRWKTDDPVKIAIYKWVTDIG